MPRYHHRTVRYSPLFESQLSSLHPDAKRCDEIIKGAVWAISRAAESCPAVALTTMRVVKVGPYPDVPRLLIYFTVDDANYCTLQGIEAMETSPGEDEFSAYS